MGEPHASEAAVRHVESDISRVEGKISCVEQQIADALAKVAELGGPGEGFAVKFFMAEVERLRKKEEQLRKEKEQIREMSLLHEQQRMAAQQRAYGAEETAGGQTEGWAFGGLEELIRTSLASIQEQVNVVAAHLKERSSVTRSASKIKRADLTDLFVAVKLRVMAAPDSPSLVDLLGQELDETTPGFWGEPPEPAQRKRYKEVLESCIPTNVRGPNQLIVHQATKTEDLRLEGVHFPLRGINDELVVPRRFHNNPSMGAVLGVEFKKKLTYGALLQAQAEWLLYANQSIYPYVQLVTDMEKGGVAYYQVDTRFDDGYGVLEFMVLPSMDKVWEFVKALVDNIPPELGLDRGTMVVQPRELPAPKRCRFNIESAPSVTKALKALAAFSNNINDVANLDDLRVFEEVRNDVEFLPYYS